MTVLVAARRRSGGTVILLAAGLEVRCCAGDADRDADELAQRGGGLLGDDTVAKEAQVRAAGKLDACHEAWWKAEHPLDEGRAELSPAAPGWFGRERRGQAEQVFPPADGRLVRPPVHGRRPISDAGAWLLVPRTGRYVSSCRSGMRRGWGRWATAEVSIHRPRESCWLGDPFSASDARGVGSRQTAACKSHGLLLPRSCRQARWACGVRQVITTVGVGNSTCDGSGENSGETGPLAVPVSEACGVGSGGEPAGAAGLVGQEERPVPRVGCANPGSA